jgi:predicted PurR-regulated permease PerM
MADTDIPSWRGALSAPVAAGQILLAVAATMTGMYLLRSILVPLAVAIVLTILVNALIRAIVKHWPGAPRWGVVTLVGIIISLLLAGGMYVVAEGAIEAIHRGTQLAVRIDTLVGQIGRVLGLEAPPNLDHLIAGLNMAKIVDCVLSSAQEVFTGLLLTVVYFGFMLASRAKVEPRIRSLASSSERAAVIQAGMIRIESHVETYIWVQTVTGLMQALASGLVLAAFGLENAVFWTITLFLLSYIPAIGVAIGSIIVALFALVQFPAGWQALAIFGGIHMVHLIVGNLIYPRLQAQTQNIDPVGVMLALSFWTFIWGIPGAFLAVPLTLILMMICAQSPGTRWVAVLFSNDGMPGPPLGASRVRRPAAKSWDVTP